MTITAYPNKHDKLIVEMRDKRAWSQHVYCGAEDINKIKHAVNTGKLSDFGTDDWACICVIVG